MTEKSATNLTIRKMEARDISRVVEIDQQSFTLPWPRRSFEYEVEQNPHAACWVAEAGGQLAGVLVLWLLLDEVHVATLAVDPAWRQLHIAQRLLDHGLQKAKERGAISAQLEVRVSNQAAIQLYEKLGFRTVNVRKNYYADNHEDALLMDLEMKKSYPSTLGGFLE